MTEVSDRSAVAQALLARRLRERGASIRTSIPRRPAGSTGVLSFAQERLWFMEQLAPGEAAFTVPLALRLRGPLDTTGLAEAWQAVVTRHEPLRTCFPAGEDDRPQVRVLGPDTTLLEVCDAGSTEQARRLVAQILTEPFDLTTGPVARARLIRLTDDDHVLALAVHHIASDGWSTDLLIGDLFDYYGARRFGTPEPATPEIGYGDYAAWQREQDGAERDLAYWSQQLAGLPVLDLATDRARPAEQTYRGASHPFRIGRELADGLAEFARRNGATPYMVLLAAFEAVLARHTGQTDFAVGSPVAGRPVPELEPLVGCFINMLTMRADVSGDPSFADLVGRARDTALDAFGHQGLPFEHLVRELDVVRDVSRPPLFQVLFAMQNYGSGRARELPGGLSAEPFDTGRTSVRFDLELYATPDEDGIAGLFLYNTDLFEAASVEMLTTRFRALLEQAAAAPEVPVSRWDILDPAERAEVLGWSRGEEVEVPAETTLHGLIAAQAARTPDAVAVVCEQEKLSYRELELRAERIARHLAGHGAGPGSLVAVCAERSLDLVTALLGVLKSGAGYLPLDPDYPADRLSYMLRDAEPALLLIQERLRDCVPTPGVPVVVLDDLDQLEDQPAVVSVEPGDIAYAIYTSGSTGRPKGALNSHQGIVNRLDWMQRRYRIGDDDVVLHKTPIGFDVSVWELFWPLLAGARLVLARPGGHKDAAYLRDLIQSAGVTTIHFVPSMLGVFLAEEGADGCRSLRRIVCSGEELPVELAERCLRLLPEAQLHNLYGPTEAAVDVSAWQCTADALAGLARVPIGAPIQNMATYVLDAHLQPVPAGVAGELYLGGVGLARGYLNRPGLTAERFVPDPFGAPGARLYRTGDLARWRREGTLDFLGRADGQVKIRGVRIELGEIEAALRDQPGVADAVVVVREDSPGDKRLVAYTVGEADRSALRPALKLRLPDYMVPSAFVRLDTMPLSPNGKLDRRALPAPDVSRSGEGAYVEPRPGTEALIAAVWREVLGVERIGVDDDFFDLGGHSLLAAQVIAKLRKQVGAGVSVMDLFKYPTIRELAALAQTPADERGPRDLLYELTPPLGTGRATLSVVCVPYGGGSAVVYQPLADALPPGHRLLAVAIPGHDIGLDEATLPFDELAERCVAEILAKVDGPLAVYGHCGVGSALAVEITRRLEAAGRRVETLYIGAIFPFARPSGRALGVLSRIARMERFRSDQGYLNWLTSMGVDMSDLEPAQARQIIRNMRKDSDNAEQYYTDLLHRGAERLRAPIVTIAGERDPATEFYQERYREWHFLTDRTAVVSLREAGHFFLKYRASELAEVITTTEFITTTRQDLDAPSTPDHEEDDHASWRLHGVSQSPGPVAARGPSPSMRRFLAVAAGQLVSITGSALTEFAVPLWIYLHTHSLTDLAVFSICGLVPGMLAAPLAGAVVDRADRRLIMLVGDAAAGGTQLLLAVLFWTGQLRIWEIYPLLACLSVALMFQRLAYGSSIAQLVPKQYLGHANGVVQMIGGVAQVLVPLVAVGLLAAIGLGGILAIDIGSYAVAIAVVLAVRFPTTMPWRRKEKLLAEITHGLRYSWGQPGFRAMLLFFATLNVFLAPLFLLISPLVLAFATLHQVGEVALAAGVGAALGGLGMSVWGGPRRRRMRGMLLCVLLLAGCCAVTGLRPALWLIAAGAFGMSLTLTLVNGIYTTIVHVKVPQRFHGRVFALNTLIAWSTLPIGWALAGPYAARALDPLLAPHGALAGTVGKVIGTGGGRGIGLTYILFAVAMAGLVMVSLRIRTLADFDAATPDTQPDDLIGLRQSTSGES
ncbi:MAG: amino acid adenylation domain-containing protein [Catenulispora sp.]|nr:amino acid adenylation domain-containing protein [Catenulispora sp.]